MNDTEKRLRKLETSHSGLFKTKFTFTYASGEVKALTGKKAISYIMEVVFGDEEHNIVSIEPPGTVADLILQLSHPAPGRNIADFGGD